MPIQPSKMSNHITLRLIFNICYFVRPEFEHAYQTLNPNPKPLLVLWLRSSALYVLISLRSFFAFPHQYYSLCRFWVERRHITIISFHQTKQ